MYNYNRCSVLGVMNVPQAQTRQYGIVSTERDVGDIQRVTGIVEKPKPEEAPSTQAVVGRYIRPGGSSTILRQLKPGPAASCSSPTRSPRCSGRRRCWPTSSGQRYDCGSQAGLPQATVELASAPGGGREFAAFPGRPLQPAQAMNGRLHRGRRRRSKDSPAAMFPSANVSFGSAALGPRFYFLCQRRKQCPRRAIRGCLFREQLALVFLEEALAQADVLGVISTISSSAMNSMADSRVSWIGLIRRTASSVPGRARW